VGLLWPLGRPRAWAIAGAAFAAAFVALGFAILAIPPAAGTGRETGLRSITIASRPSPSPGFLGRLPEIDMVKLATAVGSRVAFWMSAEQRRRIREIPLRLEREIEADPAEGAIPGMAPMALAELTGRPCDPGHYYAYVPSHEADEQLGAIVFLHGNGGNTRINAWAWRRCADERRFAIIAPTHGFGFWGPESVATVKAAVTDAMARLPINPGRVYLAGVSDGGNGVTRAGLDDSKRYRGLIYISPTLRIDEVGSPEFSKWWKGKPVLVLQGDRDVNVRKADVDPAVERMREAGIDVTYRVFPGEDHFLFFGRRGGVFAAVAEWMKPRDR
jgi:pimeloyl-ACP methyl ester carboxylesterase